MGTSTPVGGAGRRDQVTQTPRQSLGCDGVEDRGKPTIAVHRQICAASDLPDQPGDRACRDSADSALGKSGRGARVDAGTGLPDGVENRESPAVAVHRQICAAGDQPGDQACRDSADPVHQQACGRA